MNKIESAIEGLQIKSNGEGDRIPSDVLSLNVGGTLVSVLRKTITAVPGSMLATRFSGRWDDNSEKDSNGNFFIDQPFELFGPIIDYLRKKRCHTAFAPPLKSPEAKHFGGDHDKYLDFLRVVEYYGMSQAIFPVRVEALFDYEWSQREPDESAGISITTEWNIFKLVIDGHSRKIRSFEITIGKVKNMQIGWVTPHVWNNLNGVGETVQTIGIDCNKKGLIQAGHFTPIAETFTMDLPVGAVIRCENRGAQWYIDGQLIFSADEFPMESELDKRIFHDGIPAFCGGGDWHVSLFELEY